MSPCSSAGSTLNPLLLPNRQLSLDLRLVWGKKRSKKKGRSKLLLRHFSCWIGTKKVPNLLSKKSLRGFGFVTDKCCFVGIRVSSSRSAPDSRHPSTDLSAFPLPSSVWPLVTRDELSSECWEQFPSQGTLEKGTLCSPKGWQQSIRGWRRLKYWILMLLSPTQHFSCWDLECPTSSQLV